MDTPNAEGSKLPEPNTSRFVSVAVARKTIAVTVKLDVARYEQLKTLGIRFRRSNQEILVAALDSYLKA